MRKNLIKLMLGSLLFAVGCSKSVVEDLSHVTSLGVCLTAGGQVVPEGSKVAGYSADVARCGETCQSHEFVCQGGVLTPASPGAPAGTGKVFPGCVQETACSCTLPAGQGLVSDGVKIDFFNTNEVACGQSCDARKVPAICKNGNFIDGLTEAGPALSGVHYSCAPRACLSCALPWDATQQAAHDEVVTGFAQTLLACGGDCNDAGNRIQLKCNNGAWDRLSGPPAVALADIKGRCSVNTNCRCTAAGGQVYQHSTTATFRIYPVGTGTCAQTCGAGVDHKCVNGQFIDASTNAVTASALAHSACQETCIYCPVPDGTTLALNQVKTIYASSSVPCGQVCQGAQVRCQANGQLALVSGTGKVADYTSANCSPQVCTTCNAPWNAGEQLVNGATAVRFASSAANCSESCDAAKINLRCDNGVVRITSGPASADLATSVPTCSQAACAACTMGGRTYNSGDSVVGYRQTTVTCGQSCADAGMFITRKCENGVWSGDNAYQYNSCASSCVQANPNPTARVGDSSLEGGGAAAALCPVLGGRSFLYPNTQVTYYSRRRVGCGESCETYRKVYTCDAVSGLFDDPLTPVFLSCKEQCP